MLAITQDDVEFIVTDQKVTVNRHQISASYSENPWGCLAFQRDIPGQPGTGRYPFVPGQKYFLVPGQTPLSQDKINFPQKNKKTGKGPSKNRRRTFKNRKRFTETGKDVLKQEKYVLKKGKDVLKQ